MIFDHAVWMEPDGDAARNALARLGPTPQARLAKAGTSAKWRSQIAFEFGTGYAAAKSGRRADAASALERLARARQALGRDAVEQCDRCRWRREWRAFSSLSSRS